MINIAASERRKQTPMQDRWVGRADIEECVGSVANTGRDLWISRSNCADPKL